jgi:hypothetical protein
MSDLSITLPLTVLVAGREWQLHSVEFTTADGVFLTHVYAICQEHAFHIVQELRETARLHSRVVSSL